MIKLIKLSQIKTNGVNKRCKLTNGVNKRAFLIESARHHTPGKLKRVQLS